MVTTLEARLGEALRNKGLTIGSAESCTGGLVMHRLTNIPGSSAYVIGGIVAYSNAIKQTLLNVKQGTLIAYGAVSEQTASEMAQGARALLKADIAVSITGVAGPDGGTAEKPVGLTYIGVSAGEDILIVQRHVWPGDREAIKAASADAALQLALETVAKL
jgi:PncC family amidohydrolase